MTKFELIKALDSFDDDAKIDITIQDSESDFEYYLGKITAVDDFGSIIVKVNFDKMIDYKNITESDWD